MASGLSSNPSTFDRSLYDRRITCGFNLLGLQLAGIANEKARSEPLVVAINQADPLSKRQSVSLKQIAERPMVIFASGRRLDEDLFPSTVAESVHFAIGMPAVFMRVTNSVCWESLDTATFILPC